MGSSQIGPRKLKSRTTAHTIAALRNHILRINAVRRFVQWIEAMPRPPLAIEISSEQISAVRFSRTGAILNFAVEPLAEGMIVPSPVETNIKDPEGVRAAMYRVCSRIHGAEAHAALLLPDAVVRVFIQQFDEFPRSSQEAVPLLRWRLKKSVPFDVADTAMSYVRQPARGGGVDIVTTIARLPVVREYEELVESANAYPGIVSSSLLAALALLEERCPTLIVRVADHSLVTAVVREGLLCGYRCTELPVRKEDLTPQALFEEIYPLAAYFSETWQERIELVCISGLSARFEDFSSLLRAEFSCEVKPLLSASGLQGPMPQNALPLVEANLDGLAGLIRSLD